MGKHDNKDNNRNRKGFKLPEDVRDMAKITLKKFKKESDGIYDGKKELRKAYYSALLDYLPETIALLTRYGNIGEVQAIQDDLYAKLTDPQFIKVIKHCVEDGEKIKNIKLMPIVIRDIVRTAKAQEQKDKESDPNSAGYDLSDIIELAQLILKKPLKKLKKEGIDEDVAFDALCVIPCDKALEDNQITYRLRILMNVLYEHAKTKEIDFAKLITYLIPKEYAGKLLVFLLLERKSKFTKFDEKQQQFFISISEWMFNVMEELGGKDVEAIITSYIDIRKRDAQANRDEARRYYLKSLPEADYPRVKKVVDHLIEINPENEKFF